MAHFFAPKMGGGGRREIVRVAVRVLDYICMWMDGWRLFVWAVDPGEGVESCLAGKWQTGLRDGNQGIKGGRGLGGGGASQPATWSSGFVPACIYPTIHLSIPIPIPTQAPGQLFFSFCSFCSFQPLPPSPGHKKIAFLHPNYPP